MQVESGARSVKRGVSCLLCSRNQSGYTESICLRREGTFVVHRQELGSRKAGRPPPLLPNCAESRRLRTGKKNMRQNGTFVHIPPPEQTRTESIPTAGGEDATSSSVPRVICRILVHVLVSKQFIQTERERVRARFPAFWPGGGGVVSSQSCREEKLLLL